MISQTVVEGATLSMGPVTDLASASAGWAGREVAVTSVSPTQAASMEIVRSLGTVSARQVGLDYDATKWRRISLVGVFEMESASPQGLSSA